MMSSLHIKTLPQISLPSQPRVYCIHELLALEQEVDVSVQEEEVVDTGRTEKVNAIQQPDEHHCNPPLDESVLRAIQDAFAALDKHTADLTHTQQTVTLEQEHHNEEELKFTHTNLSRPQTSDQQPSDNTPPSVDSLDVQPIPALVKQQAVHQESEVDNNTQGALRWWPFSGDEESTVMDRETFRRLVEEAMDRFYPRVEQRPSLKKVRYKEKRRYWNDLRNCTAAARTVSKWTRQYEKDQHPHTLLHLSEARRQANLVFPEEKEKAWRGYGTNRPIYQQQNVPNLTAEDEAFVKDLLDTMDQLVPRNSFKCGSRWWCNTGRVNKSSFALAKAQRKRRKSAEAMAVYRSMKACSLQVDKEERHCTWQYWGGWLLEQGLEAYMNTLWDMFHGHQRKRPYPGLSKKASPSVEKNALPVHEEGAFVPDQVEESGGDEDTDEIDISD